jgi:hypothetical protein
VWLARAIPPRRRLEIAAAVSLAFLVAGAASARQGYTPRACGLDMNRNGIVGEPADCHVCDGTTTDPDFDGIDEDINYVDSVGGVDLATCGSAQAPCASLPWVLAGSNTLYPKRADGGLSDPEDILCVKGVHTLSSTLALRSSGTVGSYAADLHPQDAATWGPDHDESFRYASDPFLLVGWDADGDGSYPPFDADDRAEIVANPSNKLFRALAVTGDQIEIAHLTWSDFGEGDTTGASATGLVDVGPATDLLYLHDLVLRDVNRASRHNSGRILVSLFNADGSSYFAFVNNSVERMAGYGFRGSCAGCTDFRIDHNTATVEAVNSGSTTEPGVTWFRAWDTMDRVSVSFNHVDANPDLWLPGAGDNTLGIAASICVRDFVARGNRLIDFREAFRIRLTTTTGECGARPVDNVTIDRNVLSQAYAPFTNDRFLWAEQGSGDPDMYLQNLVFSNNVMSNTVPMQDALLIWGGSNETDFAGTYHVVNNTVHGSFAGDAFEFDDVAAHNADVVLRNNLVAGSMTRNVDYLYADSVLVSDHNVWESTADFRHRGASATSFSAWQALGFDGAGDDCAATFVAPPFDLHLAAGDTCAGDQGSSLPEQTTVDLDGEARPGGCAWDVGADERPGSCGGETVSNPGVARLASNSYSGSEGQPLTVSIQRSAGSDGAASVRIVTVGGSATSGADFAALWEVVSWADGDASTRSATVQVHSDSSVEGSESFSIRLENATGVSLGSPWSATVTIADTTPAPTGRAQLSSSTFAGTEGAVVTVSVLRADGSAGAASVGVVSDNGTAAAGSDFAPVASTIVWADGESGAKTVQVALYSDTLVEPQEDFALRLVQPVGITLGSPATATVVIADATADPAPRAILELDRESATVTEGRGLRLRVRRSGSSAGSVSVKYFTVEGSAKAGSDFVPVSGELVWADGTSAPQQIAIDTVGDAFAEPLESFAVALTSPGGGAELGPLANTLVTIEDDDTTAPDAASGVRFVEVQQSVGEGDGFLEVLVERVGVASGPASVDLVTAAGTATADRDFVPVAATIRWGSQEAGVRSVPVEILQDQDAEGPETLTLELRNPWKTAVSGPALATTTLYDDEVLASASTALASDGESPAIAAHPENRLAVVWQATNGPTPAQVRLFDPSGNPTSVPFAVGSPGREVGSPAAAFDRDGALGLVWLEDSAVTLGKLVVASLAPADQAVRTDGLVLANTSVDATDLGLAADGYGRFLVTWRAEGRIHFRSFDGAGVLPSAATIPATQSHRTDVSLGGGSIVVFGLVRGIAFQRYDHTGQAEGALTPVTVDVPVHRPDVTASSNGRFALVWEADTGNPHTGFDILGQLFDAQGLPESPPFRVNTQQVGDQGAPRIDANDAGDFAVTWIDHGRDGSVMVRFFNSEAVAASGDLVVAEANELGQPTEPTIAVANNDDTTVAYTREETSGARSVYFRRFEPRLGRGPCEPGSAQEICLGGGRFRVTASWRGDEGRARSAGGRPLTRNTAAFWFFDPANIELVVKTLDGCGVNQRHWVFAGGLTDVEVALQVDDTGTGDSRTYFARGGRSFVPVRDSKAFPECAPEAQVAGRTVDDPDPRELSSATSPASPGECDSAAGLCLGDGRFQVRAAWQQGTDGGVAEAVPLSTDTGTFSFFDRDNVELVVKVLDACSVNGRYWVFTGGLTDVGVAIEVVDRTTGERIEYTSASGRPFAPILDTGGLALACAAR